MIHWLYSYWVMVYGPEFAGVFALSFVVFGLGALVGLWELVCVVRRWFIEYRSDFARFQRRAARWERRSRRDIRRAIRRTGGGW